MPVLSQTTEECQKPLKNQLLKLPMFPDQTQYPLIDPTSREINNLLQTATPMGSSFFRINNLNETPIGLVSEHVFQQDKRELRVSIKILTGNTGPMRVSRTAIIMENGSRVGGLFISSYVRKNCDEAYKEFIHQKISIQDHASLFTETTYAKTGDHTHSIKFHKQKILGSIFSQLPMDLFFNYPYAKLNLVTRKLPDDHFIFDPTTQSLLPTKLKIILFQANQYQLQARIFGTLPDAIVRLELPEFGEIRERIRQDQILETDLTRNIFRTNHLVSPNGFEGLGIKPIPLKITQDRPFTFDNLSVYFKTRKVSYNTQDKYTYTGEALAITAPTKGQIIKLPYFLKSTPVLNHASPELQAIIQEIKQPLTNNPIELIQRTLKKISQKMTYQKGVDNYVAASGIWKMGIGDCTNYSVLAAALFRGLGIPARVINGFSYSSQRNAMGMHSWVEVQIQAGQWIPVEPQYAELQTLNAGHYYPYAIDYFAEQDQREEPGEEYRVPFFKYSAHYPIYGLKSLIQKE